LRAIEESAESVGAGLWHLAPLAPICRQKWKSKMPRDSVVSGYFSRLGFTAEARFSFDWRQKAFSQLVK
jgi:hypothetical protein